MFCALGLLRARACLGLRCLEMLRAEACLAPGGYLGLRDVWSVGRLFFAPLLSSRQSPKLLAVMFRV